MKYILGIFGYLLLGYFVSKIGITLINTSDDFAVVGGFAVLVLYLIVPAAVISSVINADKEITDENR